MSSRIEVESKFYCKERELLLQTIKEIDMLKQAQVQEKDEYFTDMNYEYIKNRTCLRIRRINNKEMELTFKGKSTNILDNTYAKKEINIKLDISEYVDMVDFLNATGYKSYVEVVKDRTVYSKTKGNITYNIMIDEIKDIGTFIEIEILCKDSDIDKNELKEKLDKFIYNFKHLNLEAVILPYRDIVAQKMDKM